MKMLSVSEAADILGVSVDVVRSMVERGDLRATRTAGNHRRIAESAVQEFKKRRWSTPAKPSNPIPPSSPAPTARPSERQARRPGNDDLSLYEIELASQRAEAEAEARAAVVERERQRLEGFKKYGMRVLGWRSLPQEWYAKAVQELEAEVTSERVPTWLPQSDAEKIVTGIIDEVVARYRNAETVATQQWIKAEEERQRRERDQARVKSIISSGNSYAMTQTWNWDATERDRARRDVDRTLREEITASSSEADANDLVDDVLAEYVDDDDVDENDEDQDDDNEEEGY